MKAGLLRHRGTIERRIETQTSSGAFDWTFTPWAEDVPFSIDDVDDTRSMEQFVGAQIAGSSLSRLRMRWRPGVTRKMRVKHVVTNPADPEDVSVDYYDIEALVRDPTHRRELILICVRRDAEGFRNGPTN